MISSDRLQRAMRFLAETDEEAAKAKAEVMRCAYRCKHARALEFQAGTGSVEARKAAAETSESVQAAEERSFSAVADFETLKAKRETEALVVEVWRSLNANRRTGNIT